MYPLALSSASKTDMPRTAWHVRVPLLVISLYWAVSIQAAAMMSGVPTAQSSASEPDECLAFLREYLPAKDRNTTSEQYLKDNVDLALRARSQSVWAAAVPWDMFLNEVLPHRNLDEPVDNWRPLFYQLFKPLVVNASSLTEAAQILNRDIWKIWGIHFKADQAPEILSPSQTIKAGYASCSGLSIFLVNACRAVGIPARVAGQ